MSQDDNDDVASELLDGATVSNKIKSSKMLMHPQLPLAHVSLTPTLKTLSKYEEFQMSISDILSMIKKKSLKC